MTATMPAPYRFVPVAPAVFVDLPEAEDGDDLARKVPSVHDVPIPDGWSGTFELEITAETPILVRGASEPGQEQHARFHRTPDGRFAIPGSSLRGMLRNVIEIAGFAKMSRVADRSYAVRDLHNRELYTGHMAALKRIDGGRTQPVPLVCAAWLTRRPNSQPFDEGAPDDEVATLHVVDFFKVDYALLLRSGLAPAGYQPGRKQSAADKYLAWKHAGKGLRVGFGAHIWDHNGSRVEPYPARIGNFGRIEALGEAQVDRQPGTLVFTGQPSDWRPSLQPRTGAGQPKHHDFVLGHEPYRELPVSRRLLRKFTDAHSDAGQQGRTTAEPNTEWKFWRKAFVDSAHKPPQEGVPVFFLLEQGSEDVVRAFGLAMMFRLAYDLSVGDARDNAQSNYKDAGPQFDVAEAIFGRVLEPQHLKSEEALSPAALAGRVSLSLARAQGNPTPPAQGIKSVLGAPKASYYPAYIAQETDASGSHYAGRYKTLMNSDAQIAGWKRYVPQDPVANPPIPANVKSEKVFTYLYPLPAGTTFRSTAGNSARSQSSRTKSTTASRVSCGTQAPVRSRQVFFLAWRAPAPARPPLRPSWRAWP